MTLFNTYNVNHSIELIAALDTANQHGLSSIRTSISPGVNQFRASTVSACTFKPKFTCFNHFYLI